MLTVQLICIGKLKEKYLTEAAAEYQKRLSGFCRLIVMELPEFRVPDTPSPAEIARCLEKEGESILAKLPKDGAVIPLCIEGKQLSSPALSEEMDKLALSGVSTISFIIGGSHGLDAAVKQTGKTKLSMSPMTFPHQLARIMLLEQIYRAFQISTGGKYHK